MPYPAARDTWRLLVPACGVALGAFLLVRTGWVCDDAYISFRAVDNLVDGFGPRWNPGERVQVFTHPLWFLLLAAFRALSIDLYLAAIACGIALTLGVLSIVATCLSSGRAMAAAGLAVLLGSKTFVDFSTSGLENPATHALVALFLARFPADVVTRSVRSIGVLALITALLMLSRLDAGLLVLPAVATVAWRSGLRASWKPILVGMVPLAAWHLFSVVYYGFPFPNTAYAKLATGVPLGELAAQGAAYVRDSFVRDPLALPVIAMAMLAPVRKTWRSDWPLSLGLLLSLAYVVRVGGDFMSGRFISALLVAATCQVVRYRAPLAEQFWPVPAAAIVGFAVLAPAAPIWSELGLITPATMGPRDGIYDERAYYAPRTGLLATWGSTPMPFSGVPATVAAMKQAGQTIATRDAVGFFGYLSGRDIHVVDLFGLADPFLARLPAERPWRIGHFKRRLPAGYISSLRKGRNEIEDPGLASFYEDVRLVTVGPLWSRERWNAILRLNLGVDDPRLEAYRLDYTGVQWSQVPGLAARASDRPGPLTVERGLVVYLPRPVRVGALAVSLLTPGTYSVILSNGREQVSTEPFAFDGKPSAPSVRQMSPPRVGSRVDRIRIQPVDAKPPFVLARLELRP